MTTDPATLRAEFWRLPESAFVDRLTVAAAVYLSTSAMDAMAVNGGGPAYTRIGRRALYIKKDVLEWATTHGQRVENTAQLQRQGVAA